MSVKIPTICPYCGGKVIFTDSAVLYGGKSYGDIYLCTNCNASVGVHNGTRRPLGTLANSVLKLKRQEVHRVFDGWWKAQKLGHGEAYRWLAGQMKLPVHRTHIGQFDMVQCEQTIQAVYAAQTEKEAA
ncbi:hypothetical protein DWV16_10795 [Anaerotruncus sp. AF02-27]|uniref:zinc-finger-containing protein n=1 Tax=Anaerotruncus TaxID=244127 RepID=UPI000E476AB2|nr:zinc-finger-containing protein [Anaerotruncus sp. AF02-27]RGX55057.1 hypothetical protein DWV16_10795 [Anaerotruncus sp. AF02-27]GKH48086.1 hypothetical protein CE91St45_26480 [Oscillospiraceae bacterium]